MVNITITSSSRTIEIVPSSDRSIDITVDSCNRVMNVDVYSYRVLLSLNSPLKSITVTASTDRSITVNVPDNRVIEVTVTERPTGLNIDSFGFQFPDHDKVDITHSDGEVSQLTFLLNSATVSILSLSWTGNTILELTQTDTGQLPVVTIFTFERDSNDNITSITKS